MFVPLFSLLLNVIAIVLATNQTCPHKCVCFNETVRCMFLNLVKLPEVPIETKILDLRFNNIRDLNTGPSNVLSHLKSLNSLLLNNNRITSIKNGTFNELKSLKYLYLFKNRISHVDENAFHGLVNLHQLYLHNNNIKDLKPQTFAGLKSLNRLFLQHNKLKRIASGLLDNLPSLRRVRLDSNAIICDCGIKWFVKMLNQSQSDMYVAAICQNPSDMLGKPIQTMTDADFHCHKPEIMEDPKDVKVHWGETAIFQCKVYGDPQPDIIWMRDENELPIDNKKYVILTNGTLKVKRTQSNDRGVYECMAKSDMGVAKSRPARMVITDGLENNPIRPSIRQNPLLNHVYFTDNDDNSHHLQNRRNPTFLTTPSDVNVNVHDRNVRLHCRAIAQVKPQIRWSKNGVQVAPNFNLIIEDSGDLVIRDVEASDFGTYKCEAFNHYGRISAEAQIRVYSPPLFSLHPENITTHAGQSITFECSASAFPEPTLTWYRGNELLANTDRISMTSGNQRLRIKNVEKFDSGKYICRGENSLGAIQTSAYLYVENIEFAPAKLTMKPFDLEAIPGGTIELPCRAKGNPRPDIQWKKDGTALDRFQFRYRVSTAGSLFISKVAIEDIATYECIASNDHGRDTASATVRVRDEKTLSPGDKFVRVAFAEASSDIDRAINNTVANLLNKDGKTYSPAELFRIVRYPDAPSRELARAAEIYERTLTIIRRHVDKGMAVKNPADYSYQSLLSRDHLQLVAKLSGCMEYRATSNCTDMCYHSRYRTMTGVCNNFENPTWGASNTGFRRILKPIYENGFSTPVGWDKSRLYYGYPKPAARLVSTSIISTDKITPDAIISHMTMQWGQFLDHDLDHATPSLSSESWDGIDCKKSCAYAAPCYPMDVPDDDPRIKQRKCIDFIRSSAVCGSDITSVFFEGFQPREQINQLTSYIDASQVYGFSDELANNLRDLTTEEGKLREGITIHGQKPLLPYSDGSQGMDCRINAEEEREVKCFAAGDIRVNEQIGLTAMHTIWLREHNRLAAKLLKLNPRWSGDTIYQEARKIVGAQMQHITYKHWLPLILGEEGMKMLGEYRGYNPNLNPTISNVFATAALRFGHSLINPILERLNVTFEPDRFGHLPLHKAFFAPWRLPDEGGVDPLMRGLFMTAAKLKKPTENLNRDLTEKLFNTAHAVSLDLAAMNVQRSRDHAIPGYLEWRRICNMSDAETFDDLQNEIKDPSIRERLRKLYGHPGNIDVWVGGILEDQLPDAKVGPLFRCLLIEQFQRLRDGDRFWYENPMTFRHDQLTQIKQSSLARVLCDNGDNMRNITRDVFLLSGDTNELASCERLPKIDLHYWIACCENSCPNGNFLQRSRRQASNFPRPKNNKVEKCFINDHGAINKTSCLNDDDDFKISLGPKVDQSKTDEKRLENVEEIVTILQAQIEKLTKQVQHLEKACAKRKRHHSLSTLCVDQTGRRRVNMEVWFLNDQCTKCECNNGHIRCRDVQCAQTTCAYPIKRPGSCCPVCT